ncbi:methyl-accepting chemotaxis protein [Anaeromyxobacter oryzae]|uniref:Methyl-accepting chemotaxis sensory transducer n=1 Tax=Anaeromyxobacter oryzae TaxID=2918170 RepID=A0ABN6MRV0_9BACT|nr:methyl-accepting chemotaxis protein [Anaeromyxobacter oryzae]BDG03211.1 hypothetical protein AMOR_22070 [Anaeromyxobacter oryzae]
MAGALVRLRFRTRLLLPPLVAAAALATTLLTVRALAARSERLFDEVREGHVPALEGSRDLQDLLGGAQRALEEAVATEDDAALARADDLRAKLDGRLDELARLPVVERAALAGTRARVDAYYALARSTSARYLKGERGEEVTRALREMTASYSALEGELQRGTDAARARAFEAFEQNRRLQQESLRITWITVLVALAILFWIVATTAARVRSMVQGLEGAAAGLVSAAGGLTRLTQSQSSLAQQQAAELASAGATTRALAGTATVAAERAETVLGVARRAAETTESGEASARQSLAAVERLRRQVEQIVRTSAGLAERARQASEISATVQGFATQSHILALNALIEAARAGGRGAGFAVVAREVRAMAERSGEGASRIAAIVTEIEEAVRATVATVEEGRAALEASVGEIAASGARLREIGGIVGETSGAASEIATAVQDQSGGIERITRTVSSLDVAMEETVRGIQDVDRAASELNGTAERLSAVVREFRI